VNEPALVAFAHLLADANVRAVLAGSALLGAGAGAIGTFALLRRQALLGDALAHATLPGVCLAFLATGSKHPLVLLTGASVTGWLGTLAVHGIVGRTRIKEDAALALTLSVFFGAGIVLLTQIQRSGAAAQAGLDKFLFGQAASLVRADVALLSGVTVLLLAGVVLAFRELRLVSFDAGFARAVGLPVTVLEGLLATFTTLAVTVGLQLVGVVLMSALLVTPAAAARYWTDRLSRMVMLAAAFGAIAGVLGTLVSLVAPRMPTGPWTVVAVTAVFAVSLLAAPRRGLLARALRQWQLRRRTAEENALATLWRFGEDGGDFAAAHPAAQVALARRAAPSPVARTLARLGRQGWVEPAPGGWRLSAPGRERAQRIVRSHRLWELYLAQRLQLPADHVHDDAEEIEHVLSPELAARLEASLDQPGRDPHQRPIPADPTPRAPA
jgi:manganese/zinc/iron transport system permease protein